MSTDPTQPSLPMASLRNASQRLAETAVLRPWVAIAFWIFLVAVAMGFARDLPKLLYGSVGVLPDSAAAKLETRLAETFDSPYAQFLVLTLQETPKTAWKARQEWVASGGQAPVGFNLPWPTPPGASNAQVRAHVDAARDRVLAIVKREPYVTDAMVIPETVDDRAALVIGLRASNLKEAERHVKPLREAIAKTFPPDTGIWPRLTGLAAVGTDIVVLASTVAGETEKKVLPLTFLALVLSFGALGASFLPLVAGVCAVLLSLGVLAIAARYQQITVYASNIITMLGLGLGIDYALFVVARMREEARRGLGHAASVAAAIRHAAPAIALSAGTVLLGMAGLATSPAVESAGMGKGGVIVAGASALAALTLLPALAIVAGRWLNAPQFLSRRLTGERSYARWATLAEKVTRRPVWSLLFSLAVLLPLAAPLASLELGDPDPRLLPDVLESIQAVEVIRDAQQGGALIPLRLLIATPDGSPILTPGRLRPLAQIVADQRANPKVQTVVALVEPERLNRLAAGLALRGEQKLRQALPREAGALISRNGDALALTIILKPDQNMRDGRHVAAELLHTDWARRYPGLNASVSAGGPNVYSYEFVEAAHRTYPRVFAVVALATVVMLFWMTRSLAIALKAVIANTLTVAAAIGAMLWIIRDPVMHAWVGLPMAVDAVPAGIPLVAFCVVFGLSMDYEVFLISRVQEAHVAGNDDRQALIAGIGASGGVITAAALIMGIVFLGFAMTPFLPIKLLGMALIFGVFLDATVVRLLLVPSLMMLLGRWNWWPGERGAGAV